MPDNHSVAQAKQASAKSFRAGVNAGVEATEQPPWVREIYSRHPPSERGYLLGVLLEELDRLAADS